MYRLNISFAVEPPVHDAWLVLVRDKMLPMLRESSYEGVVLSRVLMERPDLHHTYSLLIDLGSMADYEKLTCEILPQYTEMFHALFGENVVWFMSLLKEV